MELRVSGTGRASAADLLDATGTVDVAGDEFGRFVRPADRLRRPAPGPVLAATGRATARIVEGYLPQSRRSAALGLFFPFWVLNTAYWMLPRSGALLGVLRWLIRLTGLLLTVQLLAVLAALLAPTPLRVLPLLVTLATLACALLSTSVLAVTALTGRDAAVPAALRPWAGGLFAAPVLLLSVFLGAGFGALLGRLRAWLFGGPLPLGYPQVELAWLFAAAATALLAVLSAVWYWRRTPPAEAELLQSGPTTRAAARAWWLARWQRGNAHRLLILLACSLVAAAVGVAAVPLPDGWAVNGFLLLCLLVLALLRIAALPAQRLGALGTLIRASAALPARAHPLVPRGCSERMLARFAERAAAHLAEPTNRVILTGEGAGALPATLATLRLLERSTEVERARLGLLVAGSGLQWLYPRAFPAVLGYPELVRLGTGLGVRWRALCRGTDPAGGAVSTWDRLSYDGELLGSGLRAEGGNGTLPAATQTPTGALVLGADHWLPDPAAGPVTGRRWVPGVRGHADYLAEEEWDRALAVAAGLEPVQPAEQAALFRLPAKWSTRSRAQPA